MAGKIYILTGAIQTGKTTTLLKWAAGRNDVYGILTPVVNGKRVFMDIRSGEQFDMEAAPDDVAVLSVGKYKFSKKSFDRAAEIIITGSRAGIGWLVMDEIGPLELEGKGFSETLKKILRAENIQNLVLVVRSSMLEKIMEYFKLAEKTVQIIHPGSEIFTA
jgi:nucleoside-triphosphatase